MRWYKAKQKQTAQGILDNLFAYTRLPVNLDYQAYWNRDYGTIYNLTGWKGAWDINYLSQKWYFSRGIETFLMRFSTRA